MRTFPRGIYLKHQKHKTENKPIQRLPPPKRVIIPLQQNLGCANEPLVKVGDEVIEGQKIGDTSKFVSAPVHASIAGKVVQIERLPNPCGFDVASIVIEAQEEITSSSRVGSQWSLEELTPDQIRKIVREAGIVGMGGATFPTQVKITPPQDKKIDTIIINGCECEPYITADHRVMLEKAEDVIYGALAIAKATGAQRIIFGIENNKPDAIEKIKLETNKFNSRQFSVVALKTKYPQGGEKQLIKAILNREVPSGGLPLDVGVVVQNVGTAVAVAEAIKWGKPLIERVITVTGSGVKNPQNLLVRIGTTFAEAVEYCGGLTEDAAK
ncbi:MAG: RnfABCDGE type electron transport complex subunit C, partial [Candidatus Margulisiibacteriota bacterium]